MLLRRSAAAGPRARARGDIPKIQIYIASSEAEGYYYSGGRLCTLIGVPCRISMLSTFSTFADVLF